MYACTVAYTGQVTFFKVPEKHGHVYLIGLYIPKINWFACSEIDFDLNVDVMALGTEEQEQINALGVGYDLGTRDFVKMLAKVNIQYIDTKNVRIMIFFFKSHNSLNFNSV